MVEIAQGASTEDVLVILVGDSMERERHSSGNHGNKCKITTAEGSVWLVLRRRASGRLAFKGRQEAFLDTELRVGAGPGLEWGRVDRDTVVCSTRTAFAKALAKSQREAHNFYDTLLLLDLSSGLCAKRGHGGEKE